MRYSTISMAPSELCRAVKKLHSKNPKETEFD